MRMKNEDGSITIEAAMVMPVFMVFIVFMASIIRISVAEISLDKAVSETTEIVATHAYPATMFQDELDSKIGNKMPGLTSDLIDKGDLENFANTTIQEVFDINISASSFLDDIASSALEGKVQDRFEENADADSSDDADVSVEVDSPTSITGDTGSYLGVTGTYDMDLTVPFIDYTITLKKKAYERLWVGSR